MAKKSWASLWIKNVARSVSALSHAGNKRLARGSIGPSFPVTRRVRPSTEDWLTGLAIGASGARRYRLYSPHGVARGDALPLLVMLHGCRQDAASFAACTRMNRIADKERFFVLYPEQDRLANPQGCWNWYDTKSGRAYGEADLIMAAIDQVCRLYAVDRSRVAVAGLSAGASMAALLASRHSERFRAVIMHSGIAPGSANSALTALSAMRGRRVSKPLPTTAAQSLKPLPPLLVIQGGADTLVSGANGRASAAFWADAGNAQEGKPRTIQRGTRYAMTVSDFKNRKKIIATLVDIEELGHAWSGGASSVGFGDAHGPDASRMAWAFAAKQFGS